jgi:hypothetical protein
VNDRRFMRWMSECIEAAHSLPAESYAPVRQSTFFARSVLLSKKLGLTMTCSVLERKLYFSSLDNGRLI